MWLEYLRIARTVLWAHRFRSTLTVLSVMFGAFSIVLMSSLAESGLSTLARGIEDLGGARLLDIAVKVPERAENKTASYSGGMTVADRDVLFSALPHVADHSMFATLWRKDVSSDAGVLSRSDTVGADAGFLDLFHMRMGEGRPFSEEENRKHAKVCVIGFKTAEKMWGGDKVLGKWMTVDGVRCQVVGVLANQDRWGINFGFDWLDVVVVPLETLADVEPAAKKEAELLIKTDAPGSNEVVKRIANALLSARHHGVDDFQIFDFSSFMEKFHSIFAIMKVIVGFIAGIALLVGGIGVMNMMLVSVSERVREIGIRKALGASPKDIGRQFLCEAVLLSGTGGAIGVAGGVLGALLVTAVISHYKPMWVGVLSNSAVVTALCVSVGVGLVFGYFPARRAGKLDAILAIRR
jgi:putative ABC transport system permease protein